MHFVSLFFLYFKCILFSSLYLLYTCTSILKLLSSNIASILLPYLNTDWIWFLFLFVCRADYQYNPRGSSASVKKRILITHNLRLLKIKTKDYGKGQTLHNFMLEEVGNLYPFSFSFSFYFSFSLSLFFFFDLFFFSFFFSFCFFLHSNLPV